MLERELSNSDAGWNVNGAADVTSCLVYCLQDLAEILGVCDEYFRAMVLSDGSTVRDLEASAPLPRHAHDADGVLGVGVDLGLEDDVDRVCLRVEAGGGVVAVPHEFRVIDDHHCSFERHLGGWGARRARRVQKLEVYEEQEALVATCSRRASDSDASHVACLPAA